MCGRAARNWPTRSRITQRSWPSVRWPSIACARARRCYARSSMPPRITSPSPACPTARRSGQPRIPQDRLYSRRSPQALRPPGWPLVSPAAPRAGTPVAHARHRAQFRNRVTQQEWPNGTKPGISDSGRARRRAVRGLDRARHYRSQENPTRADRGARGALGRSARARGKQSRCATRSRSEHSPSSAWRRARRLCARCTRPAPTRSQSTA